MAYAKIVFMKENQDTKSLSWWKKRAHIKKAPVGFSWSALFLGLLFAWGVPAWRGDSKWAIIMFLCGIPGVYASSIFTQTSLAEFSQSTQYIALSMVGLTIICILSFPFFYNEIYIRGLLKKGFKAKPDEGYSYFPMNEFLDSLETKWHIEIPRLEVKNNDEKTNEEAII